MDQRIRLEWRLLIGAAAALTLGSLGAEFYARLALPYYGLVAQWIADAHPWQIQRLDIAHSESGPGAVLRLTGAVLRNAQDNQPAAILISKLQVAAIVEGPIIFWTALLLWPASWRERLGFLALGIPMYLILETATTVSQLLNPLAYGSAVLAGDPDPLTLWERWSRFLESGGRVALALCAAMLTVWVNHQVRRRVLIMAPPS